MSIIKSAIAILFVILFVTLLHVGITKNEINACNDHAQQLETIQDYYLTQWQFDMCMTYINFPYAEDDFVKVDTGMYLDFNTN